MRPNPLKAKLSNGEKLFGIWSLVNSPIVTEITARAGFDFQILDMEHGVFDLPSLSSCIQANDLTPCSSLVRVPCNDAPLIQKVLDWGAHGIVVPQIGGAQDARDAVANCKYAPLGRRGYNPFTRSGEFGRAGASQAEDEFAFVSVIVENRQAYEELDGILGIDGLDMIYLGVYDMSAALGARGDFSSSAVRTFVETSIAKATRAGKAVGVMVKTAEETRRFAGLGVNVFVYGVDTWVISQAMFEGLASQKRASQA